MVLIISKIEGMKYLLLVLMVCAFKTNASVRRQDCTGHERAPNDRTL